VKLSFSAVHNNIEELTETEDSGADVGQKFRRSKPTFIRPDRMLKSIVKPAGNMIRLKCHAEGYPEPNITWTKGDKPVERAMGTVQVSRWAITLEDVIVSDSGTYACHVCNEEGCIKHTYNVDILGKMKPAA